MSTNKFDPLTRAAIRFGSDKYGGHLYTPTYHTLFASRREDPLKILEIGIGGYNHERAGGLGLRMWAEYFPFASIVGLDLQKKNLELPPRVTVVQGSQDDADLLRRLSQKYGPFDIIIDDGSHFVTHMLNSFRTLYPLMKNDGIYAVEDTQTSFLSLYGGNANGTQTIFELASKISLMMHCLEGYTPPEADKEIEALSKITQSVSIYRNIVVFHRGSNTYPSNTKLDFKNQEVCAVYSAISEHAETIDAPSKVLSRIDMLVWAGRYKEAEHLALDAAIKNMTDLSLLFELKRMMQWAKQDDASMKIAGIINQNSGSFYSK